MIRTSSLLFAIALSACGGAQAGSTDAPPSPTSSPDGSASPGGSSAPIATSAPATSAAPVSTAAPADTTTKGAIDLAHTASSSAGPAPSTSSSAVPMSPPTASELEVIAMCLGKKSIFTEKEQKLLGLADKSDNPDLREQADMIRSRRKEQIQIACDKLHAEGKY